MKSLPLIKKLATDTVCTVVVCTVFFGAMNIVKDEPPVQMVKADEELMQCLPQDTGSRVIMTLVSHDEALKLRCEHHQKVGYGRTETEKPRYVSLTVPVDVN